MTRQSTSFEFLGSADDRLARLAGDAERYCGSDASAALLKRRANLIRLAFPIPPLHEQARYLASMHEGFARTDRMEAEAGLAGALLDQVEAALLARTFRRELVPPGPADEPAEALLARIRAQRAAQRKATRGRKAEAAA